MINQETSEDNDSHLSHVSLDNSLDGTLKSHIHIDLFAYTLLTLSVGWVVMGASEAWRFDLWLQLFIILVVSLIWTLLSYIILNEIRRLVSKAESSRVFHQLKKQSKEVNQDVSLEEGRG